jgi:hypothetical protein
MGDNTLLLRAADNADGLLKNGRELDELASHGKDNGSFVPLARENRTLGEATSTMLASAPSRI